MILTFTGDLMLGREVNRYLKISKNYKGIWGNVLDDLKKSDLVFTNLECALTKEVKKGAKLSPIFFFKSDPENVKCLLEANISYCCLANNHLLDFGSKGLIDTLEMLKRNGIKFSGAGRNIQEASSSAEFEKEKIKIKVFAFSDNEPDWEATPTKPGINYIPVNINDRRFLELLLKIKEARKEGFLVIVSAHWGPNMVRIPPKHHIEFAHQLINSGVNIFHGHSAHVFQLVEIYKNSVIFYDCGELIDDYIVDPLLRNDESFLYQVILEKYTIKKVILKPIRIGAEFEDNKFLKISLKKLIGNEAKKVNQKILSLSKDLVKEAKFVANNLEFNV